MSLSRREVFNGGPMSPFWWLDHETAYHNKFQVTLDHEVDPSLLAAAWDKTKRVYPLIDWVPDLVGGDVVFFEDERDNPPLCSPVPVSPGTEACAGRAFSVTYWGRNVTMSAFHSIVDGGGINQIFSTLVYAYLCLRTGEEDAEPPVEMREGRAPETYFRPLSTVDLGEFEPQPLVTFRRRKGMFDDLDAAPDENGNVFMCRIKLQGSSKEFIDACRRIGANPSTLMCLVMARAAYRLHPQRRGDLSFVLTMSARAAFGIPESIANCSANLLIPVCYDDVMDDDLSRPARMVRSTIDSQRSMDFIKTLFSFYETYDWILAKRYAVLTYMGTIGFGMHSKHVESFEMTDESTDSMFLMELNGSFYILLQFGKVTQAYAEAIVDIIEELGGAASIDLPSHVVDKDVVEVG